MIKKIISILLIMSLLVCYQTDFSGVYAQSTSTVYASETFLSTEYLGSKWGGVHPTDAYAKNSDNTDIITGTGFASNWLVKDESGTLTYPVKENTKMLDMYNIANNSSNPALRIGNARLVLYRQLDTPILFENIGGTSVFSIGVQNNSSTANAARQDFAYIINDNFVIGYEWDKETYTKIVPYITVNGKTVNSDGYVEMGAGVLMSISANIELKPLLKDKITLTASVNNMKASVELRADITGKCDYITLDGGNVIYDDIYIEGEFYDSSQEEYVQNTSTVYTSETFLSTEYLGSKWGGVHPTDAYAKNSDNTDIITGTGFASNWLVKDESGTLTFPVKEKTNMLDMYNIANNASNPALRLGNARLVLYRQLDTPILFEDIGGTSVFSIGVQNNSSTANAARRDFAYIINDNFVIGYEWDKETYTKIVPYITVNGKTVNSDGYVEMGAGVLMSISANIELKALGKDKITLTASLNNMKASVELCADITGKCDYIGLDGGNVIYDDIYIKGEFYDSSQEEYDEIISNINEGYSVAREIDKVSDGECKERLLEEFAKTGFAYDDFENIPANPSVVYTADNMLIASGAGWTENNWQINSGEVFIERSDYNEENEPYSKAKDIVINDGEIQRTLKNPVDMTQDGKYLLQMPVFAESVSELNKYQFKINLGNDQKSDYIVFGSESTDTTDNEFNIKPYIGFSNEMSDTENIIYNSGVYNQYVIHITSSKSGNDVLEFYLLKPNEKITVATDPVYKLEIQSDEILESIRISTSGGCSRVAEVTVDCWQGEKYQNLLKVASTPFYDIAESIIYSIPECYTQEYILKEFKGAVFKSELCDIDGNPIPGIDDLEYSSNKGVSVKITGYMMSEKAENTDESQTGHMHILGLFYEDKLHEVKLYNSSVTGQEEEIILSSEFSNDKWPDDIDYSKLKIRVYNFNQQNYSPLDKGTIFDYSLDDGQKNPMTIFVQSGGAGGGDGSINNPYATFEEARNKIRTLNKYGEYPEDGVVVYFREGTYNINSPLILKDAQDSGTKRGPVVYRSYMNEEVIIRGGIDIDISKFKNVTNSDTLNRLNSNVSNDVLVVNLYDLGITDLGELNIYGGGSYYFFNEALKLEENGVDLPNSQPPEVFFGEQVGKLARYPNDDFTLTGDILQTGDEIQFWHNVPYEEREYPPKPSIYKVSQDVKERMSNWKNEDDVWVYGYFSENWSDTSLPVSEINADDGIITTKLPSPKLIKKNRRYYIYNLLSELDSPGEYYIDRTDGNLYIIPPESCDKVTLSTLAESLLRIANVDYVSFKGLTFTNTRVTAIPIYGSSNLNFENCTISNAAGRAVLAHNISDCTFRSCYIYNVGCGGITFSINENEVRGDAAIAARNTLTPENNLIENCEFDNFGRINATYSFAVGTAGVGTKVRHCSIHGSDHTALAPGGNDTLIEYCEFYDLLRTSDDAGAIYHGYSKSERGTVIRNNYFHDISSTSTTGTSPSMIYADDTRDGFTVESNIFYNIGGKNMIFYSNGGRVHTVRNNIVLGADRFVHFNNHGTNTLGWYGIEQYDFLDYLDNPAYDKYPHFKDLSSAVEDYLPAKYNTVNNNVLIGVNTENTSKNLPEENDIRPSLIFGEGTNPGFVNMQDGDYNLREDSVIYETFPDFVAPNFAKMGMYTEKLNAILGRNSIVFSVGSPLAYLGTEIDMINENSNYTPIFKGNEPYLPLNYVADKAGAEVRNINSTFNVEVIYNGNTFILKPWEYHKVGNLWLVDADKLAEIFETEVRVFDNGIIILGKNINFDNAFDEIMDELSRILSHK